MEEYYTHVTLMSWLQHKLISVFSEKTDVPQPWIFSFSTAVTLKIRSRSLKSNKFFVMSHIYIPENLVRIQRTVHKILFWQKTDADANTNTNANADANAMNTKKQCPPPIVGCGWVMVGEHKHKPFERVCYGNGEIQTLNWSSLTDQTVRNCLKSISMRLYTGFSFRVLKWGFQGLPHIELRGPLIRFRGLLF